MSAPQGGQPTTSVTASYGGLALSVNGALSYLASDSLGSAEVALTPSGGALASQLYTPYGTLRYAAGTFPTDLGFTGYHTDATTGLDYANSRYDDPAAGQFGSADTTAAGGLNRFGYTGGSPETFSDPSGQTPTDCGNPEDPYGAIGACGGPSSSEAGKGTAGGTSGNGPSWWDIVLALGAAAGALVMSAYASPNRSHGRHVGCFHHGHCHGPEPYTSSSSSTPDVQGMPTITGAQMYAYKRAHGLCTSDCTTTQSCTSDCGGTPNPVSTPTTPTTAPTEEPAPEPVPSSGGATSGGGGVCNPRGILYTQEFISWRHADGYTVEGNIAQMRSNGWPATMDPIRIFRKTSEMDAWPSVASRYGVGSASNLENGELYTLDNRRLYEATEAGLTEIPFVWAKPEQIQHDVFKFSTTNQGVCINVRN